MKKVLLTMWLACGLALTAFADNVDQPPMIYPQSLKQKDFAVAGLWFWVTDSHHPPGGVWGDYCTGPENGPLQRCFVCIGKLGSHTPIYYVNAPTESEDTLMATAFLTGYKADQVNALNEISARKNQGKDDSSNESNLVQESDIVDLPHVLTKQDFENLPVGAKYYYFVHYYGDEWGGGIKTENGHKPVKKNDGIPTIWNRAQLDRISIGKPFRFWNKKRSDWQVLNKSARTLQYVNDEPFRPTNNRQIPGEMSHDFTNDLNAYDKGVFPPPPKPKTAEEVVRRAAEDISTSALLQFDLNKDYDTAISLYTVAIQLLPNEPQGCISRGASYCSKGEYENALTDFTTAIRLNPGDWRGFVLRGDAYSFKRDLDAALGDYTEAIRLHPDAAGAYLGRGKIAFSKKRYDDAIKDFTESLRLLPSWNASIYFRGQCYLAKGNYDEAIQDLTVAIHLDPNDQRAYKYRGMAYCGKKDFDNAIHDLNEAIRIAPNWDSYYHRGITYLEKKDYDGAIQDFTTVIDSFPDYGPAYKLRGRAYEAKGDLDKAKADETVAKAQPIQEQIDY